jgi:mono/diheme cytochrome c family protein
MRCGALSLLLAGVTLAGCGKLNMADQRKDKTWDANTFLPNGQVVQSPPAGVVAHGLPGAPAPQPARIDAALLDRGQQQFDIDCAPCHGRSGDGYGMIVQRGFPHPPPLYSDALRQAKASHFYDVITNGHGLMYSYADRVTPADRWAIVAYIRALQASAGVAASRLDAQDLAALSGKAGG